MRWEITDRLVRMHKQYPKQRDAIARALPYQGENILYAGDYRWIGWLGTVVDKDINGWLKYVSDPLTFPDYRGFESNKSELNNEHYYPSLGIGSH